MRLATGLRASAWLLIGVHIVIACGCVLVFSRMTPAVAHILERNDRSLEACAEMLTALAVRPVASERFHRALQRAASNVTEEGEATFIAQLQLLGEAACAGDTTARSQVIDLLTALAELNRRAMNRADEQAVQLGQAGAWGVVFMSGCFVLVALSALRLLERRVIRPLEELQSVIQARAQGDHFRRLGGADLDEEIRRLFSTLNTWMDHHERDRAHEY